MVFRAIRRNCADGERTVRGRGRVDGVRRGLRGVVAGWRGRELGQRGYGGRSLGHRGVRREWQGAVKPQPLQ